MPETFHAGPNLGQLSDVTIIHGDCIEAMRELADDSIDAVVCDPPYGLEFMGKEWDSFAPQNTTAQRGNAGGFGIEEGKPWNKARSGTKASRSTFRCRACQGWSGPFSEARAKRQKECVCEKPDYDYGGAPAQMLAFGAWCTLWTTEALRVLKPGGHLLAFGGTRTWHRLAVAVEDAGFEIRDSIAWLYGSGFPKSLNVGAALMTKAGLKPSEDEWTPEALEHKGQGTALKPAFEPVVVGRKPFKGNVAANVLTHGTGALNIDACRIEGGKRSPGFTETLGTVERSGSLSGVKTPRANVDETQGRWPANVILDESQAAALDLSTGVETSRFMYTAKAPKKERPVTDDGISHATVKPLALMRWLVRLVTPPGGVVLDPFAGSGTTVEAALQEGFKVIGVEREADYLPMIQQRIARCLAS